MKAWKKQLTALALAAVSCVSLAAPASAASEGWRKDGIGWWYQNADGSYAKDEWRLLDGVWYSFDQRGYMETGWKKDGLYWYYLKPSGAMATGWEKIGEDWYYFFPLRRPTGWPQGRMMNDRAIQWNGDWYALDESGAMVANDLFYCELDDHAYLAGPDGRARRLDPLDYIFYRLPEAFEADTLEKSAITVFHAKDFPESALSASVQVTIQNCTETPTEEEQAAEIQADWDSWAHEYIEVLEPLHQVEGFSSKEGSSAAYLVKYRNVDPRTVEGEPPVRYSLDVIVDEGPLRFQLHVGGLESERLEFQEDLQELVQSVSFEEADWAIPE
ncbi:MAG TPA: hypothetical protein IAC82_11990 [Candidatus Merdivicinus intestinigallinarum]|nr:hypothetical protein [Candidatus Merdivicinus intestinigallinarum]